MMTTTMKMMKKMVSLISAIVMMAAMAAYTPTAKAEEDIDVETLVNEIAVLVNEARAEAGLNPVYVLPYLNEVAEMRAIECAIDFDDRSRGYNGLEAKIDTDIVDFDYTAENIASGTETAEETFGQWKANPERWAAIMAEDVTHMGIGVVYDCDTEYGWYWQQTLVATDMTFAEQYNPAEKNTRAAAAIAVGDITGDGVINTYDYLALVEYLNKVQKGLPVNFTEAQLEAADCFSDGIITEADAKVMVQYILGECDTLPYVF